MNSINIFIFHTKFQISGSKDFLQKLENDFICFQEPVKNITRQFNIEIFITEKLPTELIGELPAYNQTKNSIEYRNEHSSFYDYYNKALLIFNRKTLKTQIFGINTNIIHELCYLFLLSKSNKIMDLAGLHKIHSCAVSNSKNKAFIFMLPMKGGKSTIFLNLLKNKELKIISDDSPVIDWKGNIYPFPLRVGLEQNSSIPSYLNNPKTYILERQEFGIKILIPINQFSNLISPICKKAVLINGIRTNYKKPKIIKRNKIRGIIRLFPHLTIGVGLPLIIEYFIENTLLDHLKNIKILIFRIVSTIMLSWKHDSFDLYLTNDIELNDNFIKEFINKN